jgi:hypothetical protein
MDNANGSYAGKIPASAAEASIIPPMEFVRIEKTEKYKTESSLYRLQILQSFRPYNIIRDLINIGLLDQNGDVVDISCS